MGQMISKLISGLCSGDNFVSPLPCLLALHFVPHLSPRIPFLGDSFVSPLVFLVVSLHGEGRMIFPEITISYYFDDISN